MSIKTKKLSDKLIKGFSKNPATGVVSIIDSNGATKPISFIGYNDIYTNATNKFLDNKVTALGSYTNPAWTEYKLLGYGNHSDPRYPNPVRANARRIYFNGVSGTVSTDKPVGAKDNGNITMKDRKEFLLYIDPIWDLNITFTDVTQATFTMTWPSAMTTANGSVDALKLNVFRPKLIVEGSNGLAFQKAGRAMLIETSNNQFPELLSNSTTGIVMTITGGAASGMKVGGVAQTSYVIPAAKLKVANWAAQTYILSNTGATLEVTGKNQGAFWNTSAVADYEYIQYNGGYPNDITTESFDGGVIYARAGSNRVKLLITNSTLEYYNNGSLSFTDDKYNPIVDIHCVKPSNKISTDPETVTTGFYSARVFGTYVKGDYSGDGYYDYDYEKNFGTESSVNGLRITYLSDEQLLLQVKKAQDYGVWTFVNAFWNFQNYNYSIYGGTAAEQKIKKNQAQQDYIDEIMRKADLLIDKFGYCLMILGNESNLDQNLKGELNGDYIFFADQANQDKQANVNAMMDFFNQIAKMLHDVYGSKILVGPSIQFGNQGQCNEILAAMNAGFASNFDVLFNNYYAYNDTANPQINLSGFNPLAYYKTNRGANKLNVILSECGAGNKNIDINNLPANYSRQGQKGYTVTAPITYTNTETNQANVSKNLIVKMLKDPALNDVCQGLLYFGDSDQPGRSSLEAGYGVSIYESFFVPPTAFVSNADTQNWVNVFNANPTTAVIPTGKLFVAEEKYSSQMWRDTPKAFDPNGNDYQATAFMPTLATLAANELPVMAAVRAEIASGVPNLIYANEI
jgi:hypothetical protein